MNLRLNISFADAYRNLSQRTRIITEKWVSQEAYCPACGNSLTQSPPNLPALDFECPGCSENYELKSKKDRLGKKIVDGAYTAMINRLMAQDNPSLFLLTYSIPDYSVLSFLVVPKYFVVPSLIEQRAPLKCQARRAGWTGCNILLSAVPKAGRIYFVKNGSINPPEYVLGQWQKTAFVREQSRVESRGWLSDTMSCIDKLAKKEFTLNDVYQFEHMLSGKYPGNKHIKDKLRQQLQVLRDNGYLEFVSRGRYRLI